VPSDGAGVKNVVGLPNRSKPIGNSESSDYGNTKPSYWNGKPERKRHSYKTCQEYLIDNCKKQLAQNKTSFDTEQRNKGGSADLNPFIVQLFTIKEILIIAINQSSYQFNY
jgi:hypothetical protein